MKTSQNKKPDPNWYPETYFKVGVREQVDQDFDDVDQFTYNLRENYARSEYPGRSQDSGTLC